MPSAQRHAPRKPLSPNRNAPLEVVDPIWLIKALALSLIAALVCGYVTLCLLYYQGEWQLVLHPTRAIDRTPASAGLAYTDVRFDASETGQPRLTAWWIPSGAPAGVASRYAALTILYLHDGSGSLSNTIPMLTSLHDAGLNVFAIDYRGFGASDASVHPDEARMDQDAAAALEYLTSTLHVAPRSIIPYGAGLGASLAATLAYNHPELPAVILDNPEPDPLAAAGSPRSRVIPIRLLFGHAFAIAKRLSTLATPKLLIAGGPNSTSIAQDPAPIQALLQTAASPRFAVTLPWAGYENAYRDALSRFLDQYVDQDVPAGRPPTPSASR